MVKENIPTDLCLILCICDCFVTSLDFLLFWKLCMLAFFVYVLKVHFYIILEPWIQNLKALRLDKRVEMSPQLYISVLLYLCSCFCYHSHLSYLALYIVRNIPWSIWSPHFGTYLLVLLFSLSIIGLPPSFYWTNNIQLNFTILQRWVIYNVHTSVGWQWNEEFWELI